MAARVKTGTMEPVRRPLWRRLAGWWTRLLWRWLGTTRKLSPVRMAVLGLAAIATLSTWGTPISYPVRLLLTFFHEMSHGLAAVVTGGHIQKITISPDGSGMCWWQGGVFAVASPAGYLGAMLWGSLILILSLRTRLARPILGAMGLLLLTVTVSFVVTPFGQAAGVLVGLGLLVLAWRTSRAVAQVILVYIGAMMCLNAVLDLLNPVLWSDAKVNDAALFSQYVYPLPPFVWAFLWAGLGGVWLLVALRIAAGGADPE